MSWLSKALGGNTIKVGLAVGLGYLGKEFMFGEYVGGEFTAKNSISADILNKFEIPAYSQTAFGQSKVGSAIKSGLGFLGFTSGSGDDKNPSLFSLATRDLYGRFPQPNRLQMTVGTQNFRGDLGFQSTRISGQFPIGRGGNINAALGRGSTQQYLTKNVRAMGLPTVAPLPRELAISSGVSTTRSRKRDFSKLLSN